MKKFVFIVIALLVAVSVFGQTTKVQKIAFGAKGVDSISGATTVYYYLNFGNTVASGKSVASGPVNNYKIYAVQVTVTHPLVYTASDSVQVTLEVSYDNTNWHKWTNAGATTPATQSMWLNGGPRLTGSGNLYYYTDDLSVVKANDGSVLLYPNSCYAPYSRIKCVRYKATSASYVNIWYTLVKL